MGSLSGGFGSKNKAMWLYPKVLGFNPPERWGHSACFLDGVVYVFGGCCGGLHFSDVLTLNLYTMKWTALATTGQQPGTRDSHTSVLVGQNMVVICGTNGSKKVNDIHILDLTTKEWSRPHCSGTPPSPRESHTATLVGDEKLVIFGGSGEGAGNYLSDVHVLDLKTMSWSSPEVKGDLPVPRDSHTAVAIGSRLVVYGGDCGDRYYGEVDVLDLDTMTWSRLAVQGTTPGVRAGHTAINIGDKVYIIGGVGDKQYYNDVWILDMNTCSWAQLNICGQKPQGRFSHTAVVTETDVIVYGGCGEDERPLNELLILQLGSDHYNGGYNVPICKVFDNHWSKYKRKNSKNLNNRGLNQNGDEAEAMKPLLCSLDDSIAKRRKSCEDKPVEVGSEQEEHSLSLSQNSSPSQSDQEQNNANMNASVFPSSILQSQHLCRLRLHHGDDSGRIRDFRSFQRESPRPLRTEQFLRVVQPERQEMPFLGVDQKSHHSRPPSSTMAPHMGAEVHGTVDGAFDSGYLVTANVNGQIFRGVLFAPVSNVHVPRTANLPRSPSSPLVLPQPPPVSNSAHILPLQPRPRHHYVLPESGRRVRQPQVAFHGSNKSHPSKLNGDLQGIVLSLGGPGEREC